MKDLITTIASILILSLFFVQFVTNMKAFIYMMDVEHCIREISFESKEYDSEGDIINALEKKLEWNTLSPSANKIEEKDGYVKYEVTVPITNVSPKGPLKYTTKCVIEKEKELKDEKSDNNDGTDNAADII